MIYLTAVKACVLGAEYLIARGECFAHNEMDYFQRTYEKLFIAALCKNAHLNCCTFVFAATYSVLFSGQCESTVLLSGLLYLFV